MAFAQGWEQAPDGQNVKNTATGQVVDTNHPIYQAALQNGGGAVPATQPQTGGALPVGSPATQINQQAQNASTYSSTPGAAPLNNASNQGAQDVVRNSYLQQATQGTHVDASTDPNVRAQADSYAASMTRAARNASADAAESLGPSATGALRGQQRMNTERAGQAAGSFEAQLVGKEIESRKAQIQDALKQLQGMGETDQKLALERELAKLQADTQRLGITTGASTAAQELALKDKLGMGQLNVDQMRTLLQDKQFGQQLGFQVGDREAYWNNAALQQLF